MGGSGSGRRPDPIKAFLPVRTNIVQVGAQPIELPNLSGVKKVDGTIIGSAFQQIGNVSGAGTLVNDADGNIQLGGAGGSGGGGSQWTSGATTLWPIDVTKGVSGASLFTAGALTGGGAGHDQFSDYVAAEHETASVFAVSGAFLASSSVDHDQTTNFVAAEHITGSVFAVSGAFLVDSDVDHDQTTNYVAAQHTDWTAYLADLSGAYTITSGASIAHIADTSIHQEASVFATSGGATIGLGTHVSDASDPHGATLTQTNITSSGKISGATVAGTTLISGASIVTAEDIGEAQSGAAKVVGIILSSGATPLTASNYPQGTIFITYTA